MKGYTVCTITLLISSASFALAAVYVIDVPVQEGHPNQCFDPTYTYGAYYSPGDEWQMKEDCGRYVCSAIVPATPLSPSQAIILGSSCGDAYPPDGCYAEYNRTKPYPGCCEPTLVCDD